MGGQDVLLIHIILLYNFFWKNAIIIVLQFVTIYKWGKMRIDFFEKI